MRVPVPPPVGIGPVTGFIAHLRQNGFRLGMGVTVQALRALEAIELGEIGEARMALKITLSGNQGEWQHFDALF